MLRRGRGRRCRRRPGIRIQIGTGDVHYEYSTLTMVDKSEAGLQVRDRWKQAMNIVGWGEECEERWAKAWCCT